ncbi:TetR/AcrR family transcriptional regulator [Lactiplantibacillus plantarum]
MITTNYPLAVQKMFATVPTLLTATPIFKLTVTMVVKAAHVSRGSFYSHFQDIYDFIHAFEHALIEQATVSKQVLNQGIQAALVHPDPRNAYPTYLELTTNINTQLASFQALLGPHGDPQFLDQFQAGLIDNLLATTEQAPLNHQYFQSIPADYAMPIYFSGVLAIIQHWLTKPHPEPPEVVANIIVQSRYTAAYHLFSDRPLGADNN